MYDVIIVGASFAGLAVASQLRGYRVLLIDRKPIGTGQTSACGTIWQVLRYWGATDAVLQVHNELVLHTARRSIEFPSPYPWCTFDYRRLCEILFARSGAEFVRAAVQGVAGNAVRTREGDFRARFLVDASGWRAVLASSLDPDHASDDMNFGVETIVSLPPESSAGFSSGLHFWYDPGILRHGVGWVFPRGETVSIGVGAYGRVTRLGAPLSRFAARFATSPDGVHGTYFPKALRAPVAGDVFVVGDAAGMCLALTGEGIRPALFFGEACGRIVRRVLRGELTPEAGLREYAAFVAERRVLFRFFTWLQTILPRLPASWIDAITLLVRHDRLRPWVLDKYWGLTRAWEGRTVEGA